MLATSTSGVDRTPLLTPTMRHIESNAFCIFGEKSMSNAQSKGICIARAETMATSEGFQQDGTVSKRMLSSRVKKVWYLHWVLLRIYPDLPYGEDIFRMAQYSESLYSAKNHSRNTNYLRQQCSRNCWYTISYLLDTGKTLSGYLGKLDWIIQMCLRSLINWL